MCLPVCMCPSNGPIDWLSIWPTTNYQKHLFPHERENESYESTDWRNQQKITLTKREKKKILLELK